VEISSFIAKLGKFSQHNTTNKALLGAEGVCESGAWVLFENTSEGINYVELLENCVNAIIPLYLSFSKLAIRVQKIAKFVKCLYKQELFLSLPQ
jgi:hypothetical protein